MLIREVLIQENGCTAPVRTKSGRLFIDFSLMEKRAKRIRDHFARTFLGDRSLAHLSFRGVFPLFLFFIKSAMKLVDEPPMTVDLSLIVAAVTDADACSFAV